MATLPVIGDECVHPPLATEPPFDRGLVADHLIGTLCPQSRVSPAPNHEVKALTEGSENARCGRQGEGRVAGHVQPTSTPSVCFFIGHT